MEHFVELNNLEYFEPIKGLKAKLVHTESQTFAFWEIEKDTILPEHKHMHKQISIVTKGKLELTVDGKTTIMKKGMMARIPSNSLHSARAITTVELTDIFDPIREDFPQ
jgi:quercetin dioxygenase-like cupin family protein